LYREAAALSAIDVPGETRVERLCDGVVWDGLDPSAYLNSFAIRA
jgi:hypothetical protein